MAKKPREERPPDEPTEAAPEAEAEEKAEQPAAEKTPEAPASEPAETPPEQAPAEPAAEEAQEPAAEEAQEPAAEEAPRAEEAKPPAAEATREEASTEAGTARARPEVPGADLEVDIVPEGADPLGADAQGAEALGADYAEDLAPAVEEPEAAPIEEEEEAPAPITAAAIDLAAGARYRATGKRKTAIARVILRPGKGTYTVNGRALDEHFPRPTLRRNIRQPLETVGYEERMDVVARLHGGGVSAQAGALRHGISRALLEADPNLRGELKRRGFLTRDARAKERKKAGLKKARKRPQFSKR